MVPFLPVGARLWGRSLIGVRCMDSGKPGTGWSVLVPVEVKVFGQALVATRSLMTGETPALDSLALQEIELTREQPGALIDPAMIGESALTRPLAAGQTLRRDYLRARPVVTPGDMVTVSARNDSDRLSRNDANLLPSDFRNATVSVFVRGLASSVSMRPRIPK